jgi:hypothetical protein
MNNRFGMNNSVTDTIVLSRDTRISRKLTLKALDVRTFYRGFTYVASMKFSFPVRCGKCVVITPGVGCLKAVTLSFLSVETTTLRESC